MARASGREKARAWWSFMAAHRSSGGPPNPVRVGSATVARTIGDRGARQEGMTTRRKGHFRRSTEVFAPPAEVT